VIAAAFSPIIKAVLFVFALTFVWDDGQITEIQAQRAVHIQVFIHNTPILKGSHGTCTQLMPRRVQILADELLDNFVVLGRILDVS
jgi:hypothetical protein